MTKPELRKIYLEQRQVLSPLEVKKKSVSIANHLLGLPIWKKNKYHLFLDIKEKKEVNTEPIWNILLEKDKQLIVSKSDFKSGTMRHFLLSEGMVFKKNKWNIPEPIGGNEVLPHEIDIVFVPLLSFDHLGNRVGYGKGFYDRFLSLCRGDTIKVGLSFFEASQQIIDVSNKDIPLDYCVTPKQAYKF